MGDQLKMWFTETDVLREKRISFWKGFAIALVLEFAALWIVGEFLLPS